MPDTKPKRQLNLEDLALHEGATVLLRRTLAKLGSGEWLEVRGDSPELAEHLAAWCRKEGHRLDSLKGVKGGYRIQAAVAVPSRFTSRLEVSEIAEPSWGLAPRGARIEGGGPEFAFTLRRKRDVWARELNSIYKQGVAGQWSASRDIP